MGCGFIYFVSGDDRPVTTEKLKRWGLSYAFTGPLEHRPVNNHSPSGQPGGVFLEAARHEGKAAGYYKDQQTWRKLPRVEGRPELWVGYWNDAKPTSDDLLRKETIPGKVIMRLGGEGWSIPTLCELDDEGKGESVLPAPMDYDEDGNLYVGRPIGTMAELWDLVHPVALGLCFGGSEGGREPTDQEVQQAAFALITANYVVSMPELVCLGALQNDSSFRNIVIAACRGQWLLDTLEDLTKKNDPQAESTSSSSGGAAA